MRTATLLLLLFIIPGWGTAQIKVYHKQIHAENVNLRQPTAVVFDSINMNPTGPGKIYVKFDGTCTSSYGDRIILACSTFHGWITNDGATSVRTIDSTLTMHAFSHTRVYDVPYAWPWTYYAVGHNWVNLNGTGIASVDGQFTVIFIPEDEPDLGVHFLRINEGPIVWDGAPFVAGQLSIEVPESGTLEVSFDGTAEMKPGDEIQYTTSLSSNWPAGNNHTDIVMESPLRYSHFIHRTAFHVEAGTHEIFALARKLQGLPANGSDYILASLSVWFVADNSDAATITRVNLPAQEVVNGIPEVIGQVTADAPLEGKLWLNCTGTNVSSSGDQVRIVLTPADQPDVVLASVIAQPMSPEITTDCWSVQAVVNVDPGTSIYTVRAEFIEGSAGSGMATVSGTLSAQFFANPSTTATHVASEGSVLNCFPNPTTGHVYLSGESINAPVGIGVFNDQGQLVQPVTQALSGDEAADLSDLPDGRYLIRLSTQNSNTIQEIIKIK